MCTNATWAAQIPAFGTHCQVIAPERRGHGHTPDLEGGRKVECPHERCGIVGLLVAMARPDLVRKLVVIGVNSWLASPQPRFWSWATMTSSPSTTPRPSSERSRTPS